MKLNQVIYSVLLFAVWRLVLKIVLDRRTCGCWDAPCETHFGWDFLREEIEPIDCTVEIIDDGKPERTFLSSTGMDLERCWWWTTAIEKRHTIPGELPGKDSKEQPENSKMMRMAWLRAITRQMAKVPGLRRCGD